MVNKPVSLNEFNNWLQEQKELSCFLKSSRVQEEPNERFIGKFCKSKISEEKLYDKITTEDDLDAVIFEFLEEGGKIIDVKGKKAHVEVESGIFQIPISCLKVKKSS